MKKIKRLIYDADEILAAIVLVVMLAIAFVNVIGRQLANLPISFTDELTSKLFVLFSLLGASIAAKRGTHLGLTIVTDAIPEKIRKIILMTGFVLAVTFCLILTFYGIKMTVYEFEMGQTTLTMQWPEWIFGMFIPVGAAFCTIRFAEQVWRLIKEMKGETEVW